MFKDPQKKLSNNIRSRYINLCCTRDFNVTYFYSIILL